MAKLTSLKMSKKSGGEMPQAAEDPVGPQYHYGTTLHLEDELVDKLKAGGMKTGDKVEIVAHGHVRSHGSMQREGDKAERRHLEVQLTDMSLTGSKEDRKGQAAAKHLDEISRPTR
jgi:hypothetical protein